MREEWYKFQGGSWETEVNVDDFIQKNFTPYDGDESFLAGATENTKDLWAQVMELTKAEREKGSALDMDTAIVDVDVARRRLPR